MKSRPVTAIRPGGARSEENEMAHKPRLSQKDRRKRSGKPVALNSDRSDEEYRVGPGRPPKEFQFKPGQSGNPKGASRKPSSMAPGLKALFERAPSKKVKLTQGEQERIVTKAAAGIEQLVNQFAKGDRHARRDLIILADKLGVDLTAGQGQAIEKAFGDVKANDEAIVADFLQRHGGQRDLRGDDIDLLRSNDAAKPGDTDPGEEIT
jgi:Family of unknown function (DUF5681)